MRELFSLTKQRNAVLQKIKWLLLTLATSQNMVTTKANQAAYAVKSQDASSISSTEPKHILYLLQQMK